jgi:hypothetical protein
MPVSYSGFLNNTVTLLVYGFMAATVIGSVYSLY